MRVDEKRFLKVYAVENHFRIVSHTIIEIVLSRLIILEI